MIGYLKQALKFDWLFSFSVPFSLAEEMVRFRVKKKFDLGINHTAESQLDCKDHK